MTAIEFENVSKQYRLGLVSTGTIAADLNRFWQMKVLGKEDPYLKIGETNDRETKGDSEYVWALKDINFKVEQGDVVGIIGRNGAGKSTLLKLLSRVTSPTTGEIRARGRIASLLEVGTGFHPEMTGRENIYMNGSILGMNRAEVTRKLDEIVDFSGCERYIDTPVKRYSSGMRVRLGFAIAAHLDPEILVVDEVLAVGDVEFQRKAIGKMEDVAQGQGRTVLFVSHNMGSIKRLCKSGVLLKNGTIDFMGTAEECVNRYVETNIADLVSYRITDPKGRVCNPTGEMLIDEMRLLNNNVSEMASDEPIEIELTIAKKFGLIGKFQVTANIFDETDLMVVSYVSREIDVPIDRDSFKVRVSLTNHSLTMRRYKIGFAIGKRDWQTGIKNYDLIAASYGLSFQILFPKKTERVEYANCYRGMAATIHQGYNIEAELV